MGYVEVARHKTRDISLYRQGDINYVINREPGTHVRIFRAAAEDIVSARVTSLPFPGVA